MTDKERAEMSEWKHYHEPLARIYRQLKKGMPHHNSQMEKWKHESVLEYEKDDIDHFFMNGIISDKEIRPEIENLIRMMLTEIEDNK